MCFSVFLFCFCFCFTCLRAPPPVGWSHTFCLTAALISRRWLGARTNYLSFFCLSLRQSYISPTCAVPVQQDGACWPSSSWPQSQKTRESTVLRGPVIVGSLPSFRVFFLWFQDGVGVANGVKRRFFFVFLLSNDDSRDMKCRISSYDDRPHRVGSDVSLGLYLLIFRSCSLGGLEFRPRCFPRPRAVPPAAAQNWTVSNVSCRWL